MARLNPGVTPERAAVMAQPTLHEVMLEAAQSLVGSPLDSPLTQQAYRATRLQLAPGGQGLSALRQRFSKPLLMLMVAVALLLLITCANVGNLMFARANARQKEIATRLTLGASRARLIRQLITESVLLALAGGIFGLILAFSATRPLLILMSHARAPILLSVQPDRNVLAFTLLVSLATALLFGLLPAWRAADLELPSTLVHSSWGADKRGRSRLGKILVILQVSLSLVLMIGAGLLARSLENLRNFYPGFNKDNLLLLTVNPSTLGYKGPQVDALYQTLLDRIGALPGIRAVSFSMDAPFSGGRNFIVPTVEGYRPPSGRGSDPVGLNIVGPTFFTTLETPLVMGRDFTAADRIQAPRVAMINESMARYYFGDTIPIGRRISIPGWVGDTSWLEIVGVVKDAKHYDVREPATPMAYVPLYQSGVPAGVTFEIRSAKDPATTATAVLHAIAQIDSRLPVLNVRTLTEQLDDSLVQERLVASLSGMFGMLAVVLVSVGLYGLVAYAVNRRRTEIGVRMALGAKRTQIAGMVLRETLVLVSIGLAIGIPSALGASRLIRSELYGLKSDDPITMMTACLIMICIAIVASYLPTRRAMYTDPMAALRAE